MHRTLLNGIVVSSLNYIDHISSVSLQWHSWKLHTSTNNLWSIASWCHERPTPSVSYQNCIFALYTIDTVQFLVLQLCKCSCRFSNKTLLHRCLDKLYVRCLICVRNICDTLHNNLKEKPIEINKIVPSSSLLISLTYRESHCSRS